jgi:hypothetical protein
MRKAASLALLFLLGSGGAALASSCAADIASVQTLVDQQEARVAREEPSLPESVAALQHRQPTPASIAQAEASEGHNRTSLLALQALNQARAADTRGDAAACEAKLAQTRSILAAP